MYPLATPALLCLAAVSATALKLSNQPCPLYGQNYPAPTSLLLSPHIQHASASVRAQISAAQNQATPYGALDTRTTVFSMEFFSLNEEDPIFTFHYTPKDYASMHTSGASAVDSDTVYRVGSVSKLWTTYLWLIVAGETSWNEPITNFVPELASIAAAAAAASPRQTSSTTDGVDWTAITVGALASHMAGIGRDAAFAPDLAASLEALGVPNQGGNADSTCGNPAWGMIPCNRTQFFADFPKQHPVFAPFQTPSYSNAAFQILAYALESLTNQTLATLFDTHLVTALNLTGTSYTVPPSTTVANTIIPYNATASWWSADLLGDTPAGGYFSTLNDMRKVGRAMLGATQLDEATTRRWMQPRAFVAANSNTPQQPYGGGGGGVGGSHDAAPMGAAVGAPWEIYRAPDRPFETMVTKSGNVGLYAAYVILVPEWRVGFSVLAAGASTSTTVAILADILTETFLPAVRAAAREEARVAYAGTFVGGNEGMALSSNITLVVEEEEGEENGSAKGIGKPGLAVTEWTLGGQDILALLRGIIGENTTARLYPTGLVSETRNGTRKSAWRAVYEVLPAEVGDGVFSNGCHSWFTMDSLVYGGVGLDEFLFSVEDGKATAVEPRALGASMARAA